MIQSPELYNDRLLKSSYQTNKAFIINGIINVADGNLIPMFFCE